MDASLFSHPGFIGGMIGTVLGCAGGAVGFYFSWRNATSGKEKLGIIIFTLVIVAATVGFIALQLLGDRNVKTMGWIAYAVLYPPLLIFAIRFLNRLHKGGDGRREQP